MNVGTGLGGPGKAGLGMLPSGSGPSGSGVGGPTGGVGGSGIIQAAEALNSTAWCLIDDGALGMPSTPATSITRCRDMSSSDCPSSS